MVAARAHTNSTGEIDSVTITTVNLNHIHNALEDMANGETSGVLSDASRVVFLVDNEGTLIYSSKDPFASYGHTGNNLKAKDSKSGVIRRAYKEVKSHHPGRFRTPVEHAGLYSEIETINTRRNGPFGHVKGFIIGVSVLQDQFYESGLDYLTVVVVVKKRALYMYRNTAQWLTFLVVLFACSVSLHPEDSSIERSTSFRISRPPCRAAHQ